MPTLRHAALLGLWSLVGFLLLVALPPWHPAGFEATLDASWQAVYAHLPFTDLQFGDDVLLHAGPYGFLHAPYFDPATYSWVLGRHALFAVLIGLGLFLATRGERARGDVWKAAACLLVPLYLRLPDGVVFALAATYLVLRTQEGLSGLRGWEIPFLFALSLAFHAKVSHAAVVLLVVLVGAGVHLVRFGRPHAGPLVFLFFAAAGWWAAGQGLATVPAYARGSLEAARGYADVLALPGSTAELVVVVLGCTAVLVLHLRVRTVSERGARWLEAAGLLGVLYLAFKAAYVRHSVRLYPTEVLVVLGCLALARAWRQDAARASVAAGALALGVAVGTHLAAVGLNEQLALGSYHAGELRQWKDTLVQVGAGRFRPPYAELTRRHEEAVGRVRAAYPLQGIAGPVDVFGDLQAVALANGLDYAPRPVFQSYHAYTPWLARRNGEYYRGDSAPRTVVAQIAPTLECWPATLDAEAFLELLRSYRFVARVADLLVLEHVGSRPPRREGVLDVEVPLGESVAVERGDWLWAEIDVRASALGALAGSLLKLPPVWLETRTESGVALRQRLPVGAARGGFLLSPQVRGARDFLAAQGARRGDLPGNLAVRSLSVVADDGDAWAFDDVRVRLYALERRRAADPER